MEKVYFVSSPCTVTVTPEMYGLRVLNDVMFRASMVATTDQCMCQDACRHVRERLPVWSNVTLPLANCS